MKINIADFDWYLTDHNFLNAVSKKDPSKKYYYSELEKKLIPAGPGDFDYMAGGAGERDVKYILKYGRTGPYSP